MELAAPATALAGTGPSTAANLDQKENLLCINKCLAQDDARHLEGQPGDLFALLEVTGFPNYRSFITDDPKAFGSIKVLPSRSSEWFHSGLCHVLNHNARQVTHGKQGSAQVPPGKP